MSSENPTGAANVPQDGTETSAAQAAGETPTAAQVEEWRAAASKLAEANERHLRLYADFENFKKRAQRERDEARRAAVESVLGRLLPVVDTFEMAMMAAQMPGTSVETLRAGVQMIQGQLRGVLGEFGVEEIDAMGKPFDPLFHEAVSQQETLDVPEGQVVQQMRRGYRCRERLLRAASVVVARPPASGASQTVAEQGDATKA
ncbi:MAG: nucleotide exchange factor GrpE [Verrucomicrobiota bacterium]|jgi:molecular chaperone GrpE